MTSTNVTTELTSQYTPDDDVKIHEENAIRLLCRHFQSHETGIPEWVKNAADEYVRRDAPKRQRVVVVVLQNGQGTQPASIACLDFSGMTSAAIEDDFRHWADPDAAHRTDTGSGDIQGGHGNGGKCYMTQLFSDRAFLYSVKDGLTNVYGTAAGSVRFGYFPDRDTGRNRPIQELDIELGSALEQVGLDASVLPRAATEALKLSGGFTLVTGIGATGFRGSRIPVSQLVSSLQSHPQMIRTLELCDVYVLANGSLVNDGVPLSLETIEPMDGAEQARAIPVPELLRDPASEEEVSTVGDGQFPQGELVLFTSEVSMRWGKKGRHNIIYKAQSGFIGYRPMLEFDVASTYRDRIYGECELLALEAFKQNDRAQLASGPLTRALEAWIAKEIEGYCKEFEAKDRKRHSQEEKNAVSEMNKALDQWKNRVLDKVMTASWGTDGQGDPPPPAALPTGVPTEVELSLTHHRAGIGVPLRPQLKFYDKQGRRIRGSAVKWHTSDPNVAMVDDSLGIVNTYSAGAIQLHAETFDGKLRSNDVTLEVVLIHDIAIVPDSIEVPAHSKRSFTAECKLASGEIANDVLLVWQEGNSDVARVSASGQVYGVDMGETEVTAGDDRCEAKQSATIHVVEPVEGGQDGQGHGYPRVLISEYQPDPTTDEEVRLSADDPPVHQRPQDVDRQIWWINSAAPLARLYLDEKRGYGYETREWRSYHIERFIDAIVQIALTSGPISGDQIHIGEWISRWGEQASNVQTAAARGLSTFIDMGELPDLD